MKKSFAENLKEIRNGNKLSQKEFALKVGTTQQRVSEWECGKCEPNLYSLKKILEVLNCSFDDLVD